MAFRPAARARTRTCVTAFVCARRARTRTPRARARAVDARARAMDGHGAAHHWLQWPLLVPQLREGLAIQQHVALLGYLRDDALRKLIKDRVLELWVRGVFVKRHVFIFGRKCIFF